MSNATTWNKFTSISASSPTLKVFARSTCTCLICTTSNCGDPKRSYVLPHPFSRPEDDNEHDNEHDNHTTNPKKASMQPSFRMIYCKVFKLLGYFPQLAILVSAMQQFVKQGNVLGSHVSLEPFEPAMWER